MSSRPLLEQSLRRIRPERHTGRLHPRQRADLPLLAQLPLPYPKLLLDTTVYIDTLQGTQPSEVDLALRSGDLWHATVTEAELATLAGLLDPHRPDTQAVVAKVSATIERRPEHRILNPDRGIWREAALLAGLLTRLQSFGKHEQRKVLNDALLLCTALKFGCVVLTRNFVDFDFLTQLLPAAQVAFYDRAPA